MLPTRLYEVRSRKDHRGVDLISDALRSVGCGMTARMVPAMQSATPAITAAHMEVLTLLALAACRPRANFNVEILTSLIKISMYSPPHPNTTFKPHSNINTVNL